MELVKANRGRMEVGIFSDFEKRTEEERAVEMRVGQEDHNAQRRKKTAGEGDAGSKGGQDGPDGS